MYSISTGLTPICGIEGQPITLKAEIPNVHLDSAQWTLNGTLIAYWYEDSSNSLQSVVLDNYTFSLTISALQPNSAGLYKCTVNEIFETEKSYLLTVKGK